MKKLLLLCSFALLAITAANAQTYGTITITPPAMTNLTANSTSNLSAVVDVRYNRNVSLQIEGAAIGTNTTYTVQVRKSLDAVTYSTNPDISYVHTIPTNTVACLVTNYDVLGGGYLKFTLLGGANVATNVAVQVSLKPGN